jgi:hypothetical protein
MDEVDRYMDHNQVAGLMRVGYLTPVGAEAAIAALDQGDPARAAAIVARDPLSGGIPRTGTNLPNPAFYRSGRETSRRAPLGFKQDGTGASFFTLLAGVGQIVTMSGKVSRVAHVDRLVIIPSAPGAVVNSIMIGDEEQVLSPGAPVELYSDFALTDPLPDDFSPLQSALDFKIVLMNTTAAQITGTIGCKARVER